MTSGELLELVANALRLLEDIEPLVVLEMKERKRENPDGSSSSGMDLGEALGVLTAWTGRMFLKTTGDYVAFCRERFGEIESQTIEELLEEFRDRIDDGTHGKAVMTVINAAGTNSTDNH